MEQQRILDGHVGVEVGVQHVALKVELATLQQIDVDGTTVGGIGRFPVDLVVIDFGDGAAPIDHHAAIAVVGNAGQADVDVLCRRTRAHLQLDLREIRLFHELCSRGETLAVGVLL